MSAVFAMSATSPVYLQLRKTAALQRIDVGANIGRILDDQPESIGARHVLLDEIVLLLAGLI